VAGLALLAVAAPPAAADFDPPDGTLIYANLPANVSFAYQVDVGALCGIQQPASVTAWLRTPGGQQLQSAQTQSVSGQHDKSFGVDLLEYGLYEHWLAVRCADDVEHVVEQGTFTLAGGEPEPPPTDGPATTPPARNESPKAPATRPCRAATISLERARTRLRKAQRALKHERTAKRRRAVRNAKRAQRRARQRTLALCAR
jgi:hypothetical protein